MMWIGTPSTFCVTLFSLPNTASCSTSSTPVSRYHTDVCSSEKGEGLFTAGIINLAFVPLDTITDKAKAKEIYNKVQAVLSKVDPVKNAGLKEQYEIMGQRMKPGSNAPGSEFIMMGANTAFGSAYDAQCVCSDGTHRSLEPGIPGKRYIGISTGLNYVFSRGSVVGTSYSTLIFCLIRISHIIAHRIRRSRH